jgi:hypothetical protein
VDTWDLVMSNAGMAQMIITFVGVFAGTSLALALNRGINRRDSTPPRPG